MANDFEGQSEELYRMDFGRRTFLASIPLLLLACASSRNHDENSELTVEDEKLWARESLPAIRRDFPACKNADIQNYISVLGKKITEANGLAGRPYEYSFTVVDVPTVNAFALPAGRIFVTATLIAQVETEAELAGVLGHEIGHVEARHASRRLQAQKRAQLQSWWYSAGGAVAGGIVGGVGASMICQGNGACSQQLVTLAAATGLSTALLIQKYNFLANNQENELEADRLGFHMALKAGFSKEHIGNFYARQQNSFEVYQTKKNQLRPALIDNMTTHPPSKTRVQQVENLVGQSASYPAATVSSAEFDQIRKQVILLSSG